MSRYDHSKSDYVEVSERLQEFYEKFPEGSLQMEPPQLLSIGDTQVLWSRAFAYRYPGDPNPGVGTASEAFPGTTNFTRGSEIANLETSCWGRAMAALGIATKRGIASAHEVRMAKARQDVAMPHEVAEMIAAATTEDELRGLWQQCAPQPWASEASAAIKARKAALSG